MIKSLKLEQYVKDYESLGEKDASIKIFREETKAVFEFCHFLTTVYNQKYGITLDDFTTDDKFTSLMK